MSSIDEKREEGINRAVNSIKVLILVFSTMGFCKDAFFGLYEVEKISFIIFSLLLSGIYFVDLFTHKKRLLKNKKVSFHYIECFIFLFIFSKLILDSGGVYSNYKDILIIFTILIGVQRRFIISLIVASYSSLFILVLSYNNSKVISQVIFNDMILVVSFIAICLILKVLLSEEKSAREKVIETTNIDYLTNVYNRRYFNEYIKERYESCKKLGGSISLIILDIDYFKSINDNYGHLFGDEVLKEIADLIKSAAGEENIVARYGGEEFGIILCKYNINEAKILAEKIRRKIEENKFIYEETGENIKVTASLGVCVYPEMANNVCELIKKADEALYKAKHISRNRVEVYDAILDDIKAYRP